MNKKTLTILAVTAVMFSLVAFLVPFEREEVFWIAYLAELAAIALQIVFFKTAFDGLQQLRSRVLGFPVARVRYIYLAVQTVLSLALFCFGWIPIPTWTAVLACALVLGFAIICGISAEIAREHVEALEQASAADTSLMQSLRTRSAQLVTLTSDAGTKKQLEALAESLRFSDPVSSPAILAEEQALVQAVARLEGAAAVGGDLTQLINDANTALERRNTACKMRKRG